VVPKGRFQRPVTSFFKAPATAEDKYLFGGCVVVWGRQKYLILGCVMCGVGHN
jgi:hypothetical protein